MNDNLRDMASKYIRQGFSVIPLVGKVPKGKWEMYQKQKPTDEELERMFSDSSVTGVGIVTGELSGAVVLDIDEGADITKLGPIPSTVSVKTGKGTHYYFKYPVGHEISNHTGIIPNVDIRANGGQAVAPPSLHPNGNRYEWINAPGDTEMAEMPTWLLNMLNPKTNIVEANNDWPARIHGVPEGMRNMNLTSIAGFLLRFIPTKHWESFVLPLLKISNKQNTPPLQEHEVRAVFDSIAKKRMRETGGNNQDKVKEFAPMHVSEILKLPDRTTDWLIEKLLPKGSICVLSGYPASFKTWVILHMAECISSGMPVFGQFKTEKGNVLMIDEENRVHLLKSRLAKLGITDQSNIHISSMGNFKLDDPDSMIQLKEFCLKHEIKYVSFDSLVRIHSKDENDARQISEVFEKLKELQKTGITTLLTHHHRKQPAMGRNTPSQSLRGSSDILASVDCHIMIEHDQAAKRLLITQNKLRDAEEIKPFEVNIVQDKDRLSLEFEGEVQESQLVKESAKEEILALIEITGTPMTRADIESDLQLIGKNAIGEALRELVRSGEITSKTGARGKKTYSLVHPAPPVI